MGGGRKIFQLLASEDVDSGQVDFCVTVLSSLGSGHIDDVARTTFDDNETVLSQGGTLHRKGERGACIGRVEGMLMLLKRVSVF